MQKNDRASWLQGPQAECSVTPQLGGKPWKLILLGAPGIGKGTQATLLQQRLGACPLSTGDVFRAAKTAPTVSPAMTDALGYMKRGDLVPDETVIALVAERNKCLRCQGGFLLDGYPRTVDQARALDTLMAELRLEFDAVLCYELDLDKVVDRLSGRRTCKACGKSHHMTFSPPRAEGVCDACGGELFQREDDRPEAIRVRMAAYEASTAPLKEYYQQRGLLQLIDADGDPEDILERALLSIGAVTADSR